MRNCVYVIILFNSVLFIGLFSSCNIIRSLPEVDPGDVGKYEQPCPGMPEFVDLRDSIIYRTILIGNQCWLKENLKWLPEISSSDQLSMNASKYYVYAFNGSDVSKAKATQNHSNYGVLYNWTAAQTACPSGWRLPTLDDWSQLTNYIIREYHSVTESNLGNVLKSTRQKGSRLGSDYSVRSHPRWNYYPRNTGIDLFGFNALPGGYFTHYYQNGFFKQSEQAIWWSLTDAFENTAYALTIRNNSGSLDECLAQKYSAFSIRCIKDYTPDEHNGLLDHKTNTQGTEDSELNIPERSELPRRCLPKPFSESRFHFGFLIALHYNSPDLHLKDVNQFGFSNITAETNYGFGLGILGNRKISHNWAIRLMALFSFGKYEILFSEVNTDQEDSTLLEIDLRLLEIPFEFKYTLLPDLRGSPYLVTGLKYSLDFPNHSKFDSSEMNPVSKKHNDYHVDFGIGYQYHFPMVRLSTEIRASFGLRNIIDKGFWYHPRYYDTIDRLNSRSISLSLILE